jgi:argininosuccinate lyase
MKKLWGGRFRKETDRMVEEFTASLPFDRRLYRYDIEGSMAHCRMLKKQGFLSAREEKKILSALGAIRQRIESGYSPRRGEGPHQEGRSGRRKDPHGTEPERPGGP